jgi:hypothetical protein
VWLSMNSRSASEISRPSAKHLGNFYGGVARPAFGWIDLFRDTRTIHGDS